MSDFATQLVSYIAPGAPATRRVATGDEPYLRPEVGFTPAWYRQYLNIDFGEPWHTDPHYRRHAAFFTVSNCLVNMVGPEQYRGLLLPLDRQLAEQWVSIGILDCHLRRGRIESRTAGRYPRNQIVAFRPEC